MKHTQHSTLTNAAKISVHGISCHETDVNLEFKRVPHKTFVLVTHFPYMKFERKATFVGKRPLITRIQRSSLS